MKLLFCLLAGMLSLSLAAQKPFEGTIRYKLTMTPGLEDSVNISIFFGPRKALLRVEQGEKGMVLDSDLLIDLDSGYVYRLNAGSKTYRSKKLRSFEDKPQVSPGNKSILGYAATGVNLGGSGSSVSYMRLMAMADTAVAYVANDLLFPVPAQYEQNAELMFVHKGHIVLGGELIMSLDNDYEDENEESGKMPRFSFEAKEIIARPVDTALLRIPAGYEKWSRERMEMHWDSARLDSTSIITDTVIVMEDTSTLIEIPPPPPPAKKPAQKKTPSKKPATKTNTSGTKKQAARKPE